MNNSLFYSARFKEGDIVYCLPIRFWEEEYKITKCTVLRDVKEHDNSVYVFSEDYGHPVYITRENLFYDLKLCETARKVYTNLMEICDKDNLKRDLQYMKNILCEKNKTMSPKEKE